MRRVNCKTCGVKNERLAFLSDNTKYTLRFAMQTGGLCRAMTIKAVSRHTVKDLEKIYMREQLRLAGPPRPEVIGVDEISISKGHTCRIAVSGLEKKRAIWFGGEGRTQVDMDRFYADLGKENAEKIRLAVMDMWKPFRKSAQQHAPQAAIVFDKFHILRHLSDALDSVLPSRNTSALPAMNALSSRGSAMFRSPAARTSATADARTSNGCCRPTRA